MDNRVIGYGPKKQDLDELASLHEKSNAMKEALERIASWSLQAESRPDSTDIEATIVFRLIYEQAKLILGLEEDNDRP
jgi:hypothetical protein